MIHLSFVFGYRVINELLQALTRCTIIAESSFDNFYLHRKNLYKNFWSKVQENALRITTMQD